PRQRRAVTLPCSLGLVALIGTALVGQAEDWPHWRGPAYDGISQESDWQANWPANGPKQLWRAPVGVGYSSMSVSNGRVFTMGNKDDVDLVSAFDAVTGKPLWVHKYDCEAKDPNGYHGTRVTPTADGSRVYTLSRHGHLFCLDAASGKVVWSKHFMSDYGAEDPRWGFSGSPLVFGDLLITEVGGAGSTVVAFDKSTGREVWKAGQDKVAYSSIVPYGPTGAESLAEFSAAGIVGRSPKDGAELWRAEWKTSYDVNAATPIITDGKVFVSSGYGKGCALIDFSGGATKTLWENKNMRNHVGTCILVDGHLYGFDEKELKCLDLATEEEKWAERKYGKGSLLLAGKHWILYGDRGYLAVADLTPSGCQELAGFQAMEGKDTWAVPVLANGLLYCRNLDELACFDVRP
ncbi:MAG: PQQ-like beta-propeller repeat protein, partial [Verrucomicrobiae bacterium]|nr:PQQ-like beta-propeller repeat protein [Verrucomicrobiae bacterium]